MPEDSQYREILALIRGLETQIDGVGDRVDEVRADAREARDAATRMTERLGAQDLPAKMAELAGHVEQGFAGQRSDLVNAIDRTNRKIEDVKNEWQGKHAGLEGRVKTLEDMKSKIEGAGGALGWLGKNMPWLISLAAVVAAAVGFKDKIP